MTNYKDGIIDLNKNTILLITTLENFLKYKPPCQTCLIQSMCIKEIKNIDPAYLIIKICDKLKTCLIDNKKEMVGKEGIAALERIKV